MSISVGHIPSTWSDLSTLLGRHDGDLHRLFQRFAIVVLADAVVGFLCR